MGIGPDWLPWVLYGAACALGGIFLGMFVNKMSKRYNKNRRWHWEDDDV